MIKIALDEAGTFEASEEKKKIDSGKSVDTTLIGGILFDDKNIEGELDYERDRVESFYKAVIDEVNNGISKASEKVKYPDYLHYIYGRNNKPVNKVKEMVARHLKEFLQDGTFEGAKLKNVQHLDIPDRKGKYTICAVVKSQEGKNSLFQNEEDRFFRDGIASNVYYHMASETVEHLIFHNPFFPNGNRYALDIATRSSADVDYEYQQDYELQKISGYYSKNGNQNQDNNLKHYILMNADVFRTIMSEQMLVSQSKNVIIDSFYVNSIKYEDKYAYDQTFLYLADSICSVLTYDNKKNDVGYVLQKAINIMGEPQLIFAYDNVDEYLRRAWRDMEVHEYYDALKELYSINILKTQEASVYKKNWSEYVKQEMVKETKNDVSLGKEPHALSEAVSELRSTYMTNLLNNDEANYIFEALEEVARVVPKNERYAKILYGINDIGIVANCHNGKYIEAAEYFSKCEKYAYAVDMEEYIRTRNRYSNALLDGFAYEEALNVIRTTLELAGGMYELSKKTLGSRKKNHFGKLEFAKTLSQAGQAAAYIGSPEAKMFFDDALKLMKDNVANRKITESYRLHYLVDAGNREDFMLAMTDYNDGFNSIKNQIESMKISAGKEDINISFGLLIYLKGLNKFYSENDIATVWDDILELLNSVDERRKKTHPWQLIYKYMGLLAYRLGKNELAEDYRKKITRVSGTSENSIVSAIGLMGKAYLWECMGNTEKSNESYNQLYEKMDEHFQFFNPDRVVLKTVEEKKAHLHRKLSYMYS